MKVVCEVVAALVDEGLLYTVPRVGTFIGRPQTATTETPLFVSHLPKVQSGFVEQMRIGFEERIAQLGGACLSLEKNKATWSILTNALPDIAGFFEIELSGVGANLAKSGVPCAVFKDPGSNPLVVDLVDFDNEDGGAQATRHLLTMGHERIAFLALHNEKTEGALTWSQQREKGWRYAMSQAGLWSEELIFRPETIVQAPVAQHQQAACELAYRIIRRADITAVVVANVFAAAGFLQALRESGVAPGRWPAIVCFDQTPESGASVVSYMRLPWDKIGSEAAQLLWERKIGRLSGENRQRLVPMQLIPRLTCRSDWAIMSTLAQIQMIGMAPANSKTGHMKLETVGTDFQIKLVES